MELLEKYSVGKLCNKTIEVLIFDTILILMKGWEGIF